MEMRFRLVLIPALLAMAALPFAQAAQAGMPAVNVSSQSGFAIHGYDVMSYWQDGTPRAGDPEIAAEHDGARWAFASEETRAAFLADPERYAPQYGGYCAYAAARNSIADVDPTIWAIHEGKLYLNYNARIGRKWERNMLDYIAQADANWPGVLSAD